MPVVKRPVRNASEEGIEAEIPEIEPIKYGGQTRDDGTVVSPEEDKAAWEAKLAKYSNKPTPPPEGPRESGRQDLEDLMSRYEAAVSESADRARNKGLIGFGIGLSDPNAGKAFTESMQQYIHEPVDQISGSLSTGQAGAKLNKSVSEQFAVDEDNDPNSPGSVAMRDVAKKYGIEVPDNATAAQLKRALPMVGLEIKGTQKAKDTQVKEQGKSERQEDQQTFSATEKAKDRAAAQKRVETAGKYGIGRTIISGTFGQQKADSKGNISVQRSSDSMTHNVPQPFMEAYGGKKFLVRKQGLGADQKASNGLLQDSVEAARYDEAVQTLQQIYEEIESNTGMAPQIFDEKWPLFKQALAQAVQRNIKYSGNGVANGPDIEQAEKQIGSADDLINWMRKAGIQFARNARESIKRQYAAQVDAYGYEASDSPHKLTTDLGTGTTSKRAPVNPATAQAANEVAAQAGYGKPFDTGQTEPETPPIPIKTDQPPLSAKERLKKRLGVE